jgi:hypothetical protein
MRGLQGECTFHFVMFGPTQPAALIGSGGTDENAIHIEENAANGYCVRRHLIDHGMREDAAHSSGDAADPYRR